MIIVSWENNKERVNKTCRQIAEISMLSHGGKLKKSMFQKHNTKSALTILKIAYVYLNSICSNWNTSSRM
jgi:uncharacterized protein YaeQ